MTDSSEKSLFDISGEIDNFFDDISPDVPVGQEGASESLPPFPSDDHVASGKKRTSKDFNPDMDAIVLTAQSPMITESIQLLSSGDYSQKALGIYKEGQIGIALYIKILDRNPENYKKLQEVICSDGDCLEVENRAFGLFSKKHGHPPVDNREKIIAFEMLNMVIKNALSKAMLQLDMDSLRPYLTLHGTVNADIIRQNFTRARTKLEKMVTTLPSSISIAKKILETGSFTALNASKEKIRFSTFIMTATSFLYHYYSLKGNLDAAKTYLRMHETHKKYWITR
jgi:hypothetical protein